MISRVRVAFGHLVGRHTLLAQDLILREDHLQKLADERLEAANRYLERARIAESQINAMVDNVHERFYENLSKLEQQNQQLILMWGMKNDEA